MLTHVDDQLVKKRKVDRAKNKEIKSSISCQIIINQGTLKTCPCSLTLDLFGDSKPNFDELIAKVHSSSFYSRIGQ